MKLVVLWSLFIGYCLGGVVALALDQMQGKWSNIFIALAVIVPGALLVLYTERVRHPGTKRLPRRKTQLQSIRSRKVANSR